ncbi:MAG: hypothetical protein WC916_00430 [Candidatus Woesearchaeota archaeon]
MDSHQPKSQSTEFRLFQRTDPFFEREVNIYYAEFMSDVKERNLPKEKLPRYAFLLPTVQNKDPKQYSALSIYEAEQGKNKVVISNITPDTHPEGLIALMVGTVNNPANKKYFPNNHIDIYVLDSEFLPHIDYFKKQFNTVKEFKENE